jgi:hypothetical protein
LNQEEFREFEKAVLEEIEIKKSIELMSIFEGMGV